jgi:cytochrome c biogenesis protein CcmG, thiol:disulfide interchange protein DsbE
VRSSAAEPSAHPDKVLKWIAAVVGACLAGFIAFVVIRGPSHPTNAGTATLKVPPPPLLKAGTTAPAFSLPPLRSGGPVTLADYRGTPVIVNFFASWCPDCREELAAVAAVARDAAGRVAVVGVDSNETSAATAENLLTVAHATYPVALDAGAKVATRYLVDALPVSYFLDAQGRVVGAALGPQTVSSLQRWVSRLERQP